MPSSSRPTSPLVLAIDIGTSSVRTALFDREARIIRSSKASQTYRVRHSLDHAAELDPAVLLRAAKKCLHQTRSRLTRSYPTVVAGCGFWHSLLGVDRAGDPLTPIYTWADARSAPDAARLREQFDEQTIQQRTGCLLRASFWPAKLAWLRRTEPQLVRRVARWLSPAEWLFEKVFGARGCSHSMASGTGLYDTGRRSWDDELLAHAGLTTSQVGSLGDKLESDGTIFLPAIGDGAAGNIGSGATRPGLVAINIGTSAAVRTIPPNDAPLPLGLFRFLIDEQRTLLGGAISNAGNLHAWCLRELRLPDNSRTIEKLLRSADRSGAGLTILPFWVEERAPTWPENIAGAIVGITQATTAADLFWAIIAASCHRLAEILALLETAAGRAKKIIVSGGILQSPASLQILADSLGRELYVCTEQEASLRGAAIHAVEQIGGKVDPPKTGRRIRPDRRRARAAGERRRKERALEDLLLGFGQ